MQLSSSDIQRLYGKRFFLLEDSLQVSPQAETPVQEEASSPEEPTTPDWLGDGPVDWKLKPHARVAFVLPPQEFSNKDLTTFFKGKVVEAHIDLKTIGFGILGESAAGWDLASVATHNPDVKRVLLCHESSVSLPGQPHQLGEIAIYLAPSLQRARLEEAAAQELASALQQLISD